MIKLKLNPNIKYILNERTRCGSFSKKTLDRSFTPKKGINTSFKGEGLGINKSLSSIRSYSSKGENKSNICTLPYPNIKRVPHCPRIPKLPNAKNKPNITSRLKSLSIAVSEMAESAEDLSLSRKVKFMNKFYAFYESSKQVSNKLIGSNKITSHIDYIKRHLDEMLIKCKRDEMDYFKGLERIKVLEKEVKYLTVGEGLGSKQIYFLERENETISILQILNKTIGGFSRGYSLFHNQLKTEFRERKNNFIKEKYGEGKTVFRSLFEDYEIDILKKIGRKFKSAITSLYQNSKSITEKYKLYLDIIKPTGVLPSEIIHSSEIKVSNLCGDINFHHEDYKKNKLLYKVTIKELIKTLE
jgi:hypothetical protein